MEAYLDAVAPVGRPHLREKSARLRPLLDWCAVQRLDPAQATAKDLGSFRAWLWNEWRNLDGQLAAFHTKRHTLGMVRAWYRWLVQAGHRADDPAATALDMTHRGPSTRARFAHTPLHPLMEAYLEHHRLRSRPTTARSVDLALRQFAAWCIEQQIDPMRLTRDQADSFLVWLSREARTPAGEPLARQTVCVRIAAIKSWYEWLEVRREIIVNPAAKLRIRVVKSRVVVREHLCLQEAIAMVQTQAQAAIDTPHGTITWARRMRLLVAVCLCLATGRRIGGLIAIRVEDIDLDRKELRVEREKGRTGRVLPVAEWAIAVVRTYLHDVRPLLVATADVPWLLVGATDDGMMTRTALGEALASLIAQTIATNPDLTELPAKTITWHSLRVSFATLLFSNGCPIRSVNELMLHRCLSTTARYTPIPIEDMQRIWHTAHPRP
jgi:site-specific recombinase XerD